MTNTTKCILNKSKTSIVKMTSITDKHRFCMTDTSLNTAPQLSNITAPTLVTTVKEMTSLETTIYTTSLFMKKLNRTLSIYKLIRRKVDRA